MAATKPVIRPWGLVKEKTCFVFQLLSLARLQLTIFFSRPGWAISRHWHKTCTDMFIILWGKLAIRFGENDNWIIMSRFNMIVIPPNTPHEIIQISGPVIKFRSFWSFGSRDISRTFQTEEKPTITQDEIDKAHPWRSRRARLLFKTAKGTAPRE